MTKDFVAAVCEILRQRLEMEVVGEGMPSCNLDVRFRWEDVDEEENVVRIDVSAECYCGGDGKWFVEDVRVRRITGQVGDGTF